LKVFNLQVEVEPTRG